MVLLDVNVLVALAWDSHVHHLSARGWFREAAAQGWSSCSLTENGFVRISSNARVLPAAVSTADARTVLAALRAVGSHRFLTDDVSPLDPDVPTVQGSRQVTDAHLVTLARRSGHRVATFDRGLADLGGADVVLLTALA